MFFKVCRSLRGRRPMQEAKILRYLRAHDGATISMIAANTGLSLATLRIRLTRLVNENVLDLEVVPTPRGSRESHVTGRTGDLYRIKVEGPVAPDLWHPAA